MKARCEQIGKDCSGFADDLQRPARRPLQIVELHVHWQAVDVHEDRCGVLDIDLERASPSADRNDPPWPAEQPVQIIHLVNLREDHAAALIAARRIHPPVIFVRMPARKIVARLSADCQNSPQAGRAENLTHAFEQRMEAPLICYERDVLLRVDGRDQIFDPVPPIGQWFLDEEVTAGLGCRDRNQCMQMTGIAHEYDIRMSRQTLIERWYGPNSVVFFKSVDACNSERIGEHG